MAIIFPNTQISSDSGLMKFDGYVRSSVNNVPAFLVQHDSNSNLTTSNGRPISWDQTIYDNGDNMSSTTFTAPLDGIYWFYVWIMALGSNTNNYWDLRVNNSVNFSDNTKGFRCFSSGNSSHYHHFPSGGLVSLNDGDAVTVYIGSIDRYFYGGDHHYTMFQGCYLGRQ